MSGSSPHTWRILNRSEMEHVATEDHLHIRGEYSVISLYKP